MRREMSLTSDSGACSVSSSDVCGRDAWDPEEEEDEEHREGDEEEEEEEEMEDGEAEAAVAAAAAAAAAAIRAAELDGIEFVSDADAAAAAGAAACYQHHQHRRRQLSHHHRRQGVGRPPAASSSSSQAADGRQLGPRGGVGGGRAYSQDRERVRRERFIELYGKLHAAIPSLQVCKRVTHRKILTETAVYLASTIAQIKARRRVNKLRALLVQLEADTAYMRRLSGMPHGLERQQQQQQQHYSQQYQHQQYRKGLPALEDATASAALSVSDCLLIG